MRKPHMFLIILIFLCFSSVFAAPPDPDKINDRLNSKFEELNSSLDSLVDKAVYKNGDLFTEAQKKQMLEEKDRARRSRQRVHEAGGLKGLARKGKMECVIVEIIGDGIGNDDDVCEKGEICLEVVGDNLGDEDGECEWKFCGKKEPCVENCKQGAVEDVGENYELETTEDIEGTINDVNDILDDASSMLDARSARMKAMAAFEQATNSDDKCSLLPVVRQRSHTYEELQAFLAASKSAEIAHNICDSGCNQDFFGNNCSAACVVLAVAAGIVDSITVACELQDDTETADQVDAACSCLNQLGQKVNGLGQKVNGIEEQISVLKEMVQTTIELLNTPQGQRPDFPLKK